MTAFKPGAPGDAWSHPGYSVQVRGRKYLWGSAGLGQDVAFAKPPILHVANDASGEPVTIGTRVAAGATTALGVLQPGERISLSVNDIAGVYAESALDSVVHCLIC